jgi:flagellar hook-associated protein 2
MPVLQAQGIGSGLDVAGLVNQLVAAERDPVVKRLDSRQSVINGQISAWGSVTSSLSALQSALTDLKSATAFQQRSTSSSDETVATATATTDAALGNYSLTVNQIAKAQQLTSTTGIPDTDTTVVGTGSLEISIGGGAATTVTIGGTGTLADIRDAINTQVTDVTAVIINDGTNNFLSINANDTGTANSITITAAGDGDGNPTDNAGLSQFINANMNQITPAQDANFDLNGVSGITSSSNTVTSAVSGVTLSLVAAGTTDITVGTDTAAAKANIQSFVDAYNKVITTINSVSKYTEGATTQGPLLSDSMARNLKTSLQTIVGDVSSNTGVFKTLTALGYATDSTTGTLTLKDSSALDSAMSSNYNDVGLLVSDIATSVDSYIDNYLGTTGMISDRTDSLNNQLDDIQSQRDQLDSRISLLRERYTKQFSALDGMIAKMNSTMSYLQQQLANLPG